ncbi:MAG: hypothetical protein K0R50_2438 [Eubacterium sp.]|jgi:hypothetical protein|nr:hypothetical protein [Eubacterium sp.]
MKKDQVLKSRIDLLRQQLNSTSEKDSCMQSGQLLELSAELDELLNNWLKTVSKHTPD